MTYHLVCRDCTHERLLSAYETAVEAQAVHRVATGHRVAARRID